MQFPASHDVPVFDPPLHSVRPHLKWRLDTEQNYMAFDEDVQRRIDRRAAQNIEAWRSPSDDSVSI